MAKKKEKPLPRPGQFGFIGPLEKPAPRSQKVTDDGVVTVFRMRKVLGQPSDLDAGPTEKRLRDMLVKGVAPYLAKIEELEAKEGKESRREAELARLRAENAELKAELSGLKMADEGAGEDPGAARARGLIERILAETHS